MKLTFNRLEGKTLSWLIRQRWLAGHPQMYNSLDDRLQIVAIERLAMQGRIRRERRAA